MKLKQFIKRDTLTAVLRFQKGALILYAEVPKLANITAYSVYPIYRYSFFPMHAEIFGQTVNIAQIFGTVGPYIGTLIGLGLVFGVFTRLSAIGWASMCLLFIVMKLDYMLIQGRPAAPCGCFTGFLANMYMNQSIWIDIVCIPLSLQIILANPERKFLALWSLLPEKWRSSRLRLIW